MKKLLSSSFLLISICLIGCSKTPKTVELLSLEKVREIALAEVGSGQIVAISYDDYHRAPHYEVEILDGQIEYEFEISAIDGSILKRKMETREFSSNLVNINDEKAREIVLNQVEQGTIIKFKLDYDDNYPVYEATVIDSTYKYKFEISAVDGSIMSQKQDLINKPNA